MEEGIEKLRGEYKQLLIEQNQMSELRRSSRDAAINLQKLRQQSPELLGHLPKFDTSNM